MIGQKLTKCSTCGGQALLILSQPRRTARAMCSECHGRDFPSEREADTLRSREAFGHAKQTSRKMDGLWRTEMASRCDEVQALDERLRSAQYGTPIKRKKKTSRDRAMHRRSGISTAVKRILKRGPSVIRDDGDEMKPVQIDVLRALVAEARKQRDFWRSEVVRISQSGSTEFKTEFARAETFGAMLCALLELRIRRETEVEE